MQLRRFALADLCVLIAIVALCIAILAPDDWRSYLDHNPDNSFPIQTLDPQLITGASGNDPVKIIVTERTRDEDGDWDLTCLLLNAGTTPIYYSGYSPTHGWPRQPEGLLRPRCMKQVRRGTDWEDVPAHRCGNGLTRRCLKPGQAGHFYAGQQATQPDVKIGLSYATSRDELMQKAVWATVNSTHEKQ